MLYGAARGGRPTSGTTAAVEMLDEVGGAYAGFEAASVRVGRAVAAMRAEGNIAHRRLGEQADQFLAIDGITMAAVTNISRVVGGPCPGSQFRPTDARVRPS